jgi:hypothetical protein
LCLAFWKQCAVRVLLSAPVIITADMMAQDQGTLLSLLLSVLVISLKGLKQISLIAKANCLITRNQRRLHLQMF